MYTTQSIILEHSPSPPKSILELSPMTCSAQPFACKEEATTTSKLLPNTFWTNILANTRCRQKHIARMVALTCYLGILPTSFWNTSVFT